jgi:hypothetical protein
MKAGKQVGGEAGTRKRVAWTFWAICGRLHWSTALMAQESIPRWRVAAGSGFVFRTVQSGSFGVNLRVARVIPVVEGLYLEPGVTWHGYLSSDAWSNWGEDSPCPPGGCNTEPRRDGIGFAGLEIGVAYLKPGATNSVHPVAGLGLYRSTARSTATTRFGASLGLAFPFRGSFRGPALDVRYFRMLNDARFTGLLSCSLGGTF